jgi:uncharacterized protein YlxW (UPF0749 family)
MPQFEPRRQQTTYGGNTQKRTQAKKEYARTTAERARRANNGKTDCQDNNLDDNLPEYSNFYDSLGISSDATQRQIKNRFMMLARSHHPDRNQVGDEMVCLSHTSS